MPYHWKPVEHRFYLVSKTQLGLHFPIYKMGVSSINGAYSHSVSQSRKELLKHPGKENYPQEIVSETPLKFST